LNYLQEKKGKDGIVGAMNLNKREIHIIKIEPIGNKLWTKVYFNDGTHWIPALWEQGYIAYAVARCEEKKYKNLEWDAKDKPRDYLIQCIKAKSEKKIIEISKKFGLEYDTTGKTRESFIRLLEVIKRSALDEEKKS